MKSKRIIRLVLPILFVALSASILWTYLSIKKQPTRTYSEGLTLSVIPEYEIITGRQLTVWPKGSRLPQGMASYFYSAEPLLILKPKVLLSGAGQVSLQGKISSRIILQSVNDKGQVYWQYQYRGNPEEDYTLTKNMVGQADRSEYAAGELKLELLPAYEAINRISEELLYQVGTFQTLLITELTVTGEIEGVQREVTLLQTLPITMQATAFTLPKTEEAAAELALIATEDVPGLGETIFDTIGNQRLPFGITALLLLLIFLLLMLGRSRHEVAAEHRRFREWITEGSVELKDRLQIHIHELEGLVDLAIDLDRRVIYDTRLGSYYVLTEDMVYVYDPAYLKGLLDHKQQLGKLLLEQKILSPEQLELGLLYQKKIGRRLGESLIALGLIDETTLYSTLAAQAELNYYELDPNMEVDTGWLDRLKLSEAKALMSLPLGLREDGRLVIASAEPAREHMKDTLQEIFGKDIYLIAVKPSAINTILERLEAREREETTLFQPGDMRRTDIKEGLSADERDRFRTFYLRGILIPELLLRAAGILKSGIMSQVPEKENLLSWLVNKNMLSSSLAALLKGLGKVLEEMDFMQRQKRLPSVTEVLAGAGFITAETKAWAEQEEHIRGVSADSILINNYLTSEETIREARLLLAAILSMMGELGG
jgi:hypothetical protein